MEDRLSKTYFIEISVEFDLFVLQTTLKKEIPSMHISHMTSC